MLDLFHAVLGGIMAAIFVAIARRYTERENGLFALGLLIAALAYPAYGLGALAPSRLGVEAAGVIVFAGFAILGVYTSAWFLVLGWAAHGLWDLVIPASRDVGYLPSWYAVLCLGFDVVIAGYLAGRASAKIPPFRSEGESAAA
ncbi:MAG: hypothetical protein HRU02_15970 [Myxococcales bacterium]|nr:hypothetical protein [Myxococcales bacterium]